MNGKKKNLTTKIFCLTRLLGIEGEIKSFPDKQKLEDFTTIKLSSHTHKKVKGHILNRIKDHTRNIKITKANVSFVVIVV